MRWLTGLVVVLGCLWGGYWFVGERGFEAAARNWFFQLEAKGKTATHDGLVVHGFPNRFDLTVTTPHIADPATGFDWQAPFFQVLSLSYKPWHVIAAFPTEQRLTLPPEAMTIRSSKLQASVIAKPQPSLPLDRVALVGEGVEVLGDNGWTLRADALQIASRVDESRLNSHEIGVNVTNLTPDAQLMALFDGILPPQVALIRVDALAGLSAPLDRFILETQPRLAKLDLKDLRVDWGSMTVSATGNVVADSAGYAEGEAMLRLENWRVALDVAQTMGLLTAESRKLWDRAATFLAKRSEGTEAIELPLKFKRGLTLIGPIPVGPAPRFYLQ